MIRLNPALVTTVIAVLVAGGVLLASTSGAGAETNFIVNSGGDLADVVPQDGACDANGSVDGNQCTLRAAIQEANTAPGADTIQFGIPRSGVRNIQLTSQLPTLTDTSGPTTIDGYTQPGSSANISPLASNAKIMVQIEGRGDKSFAALAIQSPGNVVRGLAFYRLGGAIRLSGSGADGNHIEGNFLGTNAAGTYLATRYVMHGNASGVRLSSGASGNVIGGAAAADRNVISGNPSHGVGIYPGQTDSNVIAGNIIGLTPSGKDRLANKAVGVDVNYGSSHNVIGGALPGERNVISGNGREGVEVSHHSDMADTYPTANRVIGNFFGTNLTGESAPAYAHNGHASSGLHAVHLVDGAKDSVVARNVIGSADGSGVGIDGAGLAAPDGSPITTGNEVYGNRIGVSRQGAALPNRVAGIEVVAGATGSRIGPGNVISNNAVGVRVTDGRANSISGNSIYRNSGLGIDLAPIGRRNRNDRLDSDRGANRRQNFPVITSARTTSGGSATIRGTMDGSPNTTFRVEFFSNPKGTDEGRYFVGFRSVTTADDGRASFVYRPAKVVVSGRTITATATAGANTSEFSAPRTVTRR